MIWLKIGFVTWLFIRWLYVEDTHFLVTWKLKLAMIFFLNSWELIFTVTKKECSIDWSKNRLNYFCQCAWFGKLKDGFSSWLALTMKTKRVEPFVFSLRPLCIILRLSLLEKFQKLLESSGQCNIASVFYILLIWKINLLQHELAAQEDHGDVGGQERGCQGTSGARP